MSDDEDIFIATPPREENPAPPQDHSPRSPIISRNLRRGSATSQATPSDAGAGVINVAPAAEPLPPVSETARSLDDSSADFQDSAAARPLDVLKDVNKENPTNEKKKKKAKKRKAEEIEEESEEGSCCTICFENWTNSGDHRISSLRCGHFFGYVCIEKWLRGSGASCPNCNEKSTKKDIRVHYVSRLKAIDTSERDRALADLEDTRAELRQLQAEQNALKVRLSLQNDEITRLKKGHGSTSSEASASGSGLVAGSSSQREAHRLVYQRRHEILKASRDQAKCCRLLAYCQPLGMLAVSQPSFTQLAPGFGVRRFNMLEQKLGNFVPVMREPLRDMEFHPTNHELLLTCGQDKTARIHNMSSCQEVTKFNLDTEVWACAWSSTSPHIVYLGNRRSQILIYNTASPNDEPTVLTFPGAEHRPIIGLKFVPAAPTKGFPFPGLLSMTLGSVWYWSIDPNGGYTPYRLPVTNKLFWSMDFEPESRLILLSCRPSPQISGGSFTAKSFLRSCLFPVSSGQVFLVFSRGSGTTDHRVIVQEVGTDRIVQELHIGKLIVDMCGATINNERKLALLSETDLTLYQWQ